MMLLRRGGIDTRASLLLLEAEHDVLCSVHYPDQNPKDTSQNLILPNSFVEICSTGQSTNTISFALQQFVSTTTRLISH